VSRDIKELHLVKVPAANDRYKYSTPNEQRTNPRHKLKRLIMEAFVSIDYANHFIVLKTLPGNAHAIGVRSEEQTSELQSRIYLFCTLSLHDALPILFRVILKNSI